MNPYFVPWEDLAEAQGHESAEKMLRVMYATMGCKKIAGLLGVDAGSVRGKLGKLGITIKGPGGPNNLKHGRYVGEHAKRCARDSERRTTKSGGRRVTERTTRSGTQQGRADTVGTAQNLQTGSVGDQASPASSG